MANNPKYGLTASLAVSLMHELNLIGEQKFSREIFKLISEKAPESFRGLVYDMAIETKS